MLLTALTFAALLQAAPVAGQKGYLLQQKPFATDERVDQLRMPFPKKAKPIMDEAERGSIPWSTSPRIGRTSAPPPKKRVVRMPYITGCGSNPMQRAGHPEDLKAQPLSKLPKAHGERAVARLVDGCPVSVLIAQNDPLH